MAKNYYLPTDDSGKADLLDHFAAKLLQYADTLEISAADVASAQADAANWRYDLQAQQRSQAYAQQWTNHKNSLRDGGAEHADPPAPLILPPAPAPVAPRRDLPLHRHRPEDQEPQKIHPRHWAGSRHRRLRASDRHQHLEAHLRHQSRSQAPHRNLDERQGRRLGNLGESRRRLRLPRHRP